MAEPKPPAGADGPHGNPPGAGDPSMEDILASIRRILNEDDPATGSPLPTPPAHAPAEAADEPLDLTPEMLVASPPGSPAAAQPPSGQPARPPAAEPTTAPLLQTPATLAAAEPTPPTIAAPPPEPPAPAASPASDALLAPAVAAAASASLGQLLRTVAAERSSAVRGGGPTIEDVVREELRPLLKAWLDQHLPGVVERLVRAEIERMVGRALS
jgi:cell pole-organizing protein PopZ